ncbi:MAG: conjugative transposon protein TraM [Alistipes indistinctus]
MSGAGRSGPERSFTAWPPSTDSGWASKSGGIEDGGEIVPVSLKAYDLDGGEGLYVPDSKERTAAKEAAASIGTGLGTSISFARSAGQQVAMDLVRGAMTGGTQYAASRLREVRVTVKAGYRLLLISQSNAAVRFLSGTARDHRKQRTNL